MNGPAIFAEGKREVEGETNPEKEEEETTKKEKKEEGKPKRWQ